jgi:hypothetical protein
MKDWAIVPGTGAQVFWFKNKNFEFEIHEQLCMYYDLIANVFSAVLK